MKGGIVITFLGVDITTHNHREEYFVELAELKLKDAERQANAGYSITDDTLTRIYHMIEDMFFLEMLNSEQYQMIAVHFEKFRIDTIRIKEKNAKRFIVGKLRV
ncbi:MAG: hypothetical protein SOW08_13430 [Lachnospiraceae bacterium]|nr:hypothetical protein [Lachnospiraceae bacterium]